VLSIGGGSATGAAKAVALTARIPVIAVPTTYAGSEVTPVWGLTEGGRKTTGTDPAVLPRVAVYDPELVATLPAELTVASSFNAVAHGVEAFWAPRRNPASTAIAEEGVAAVVAGLRRADPVDLLRGAWLTATAFAVAGSGLHHKLCHVLGGMLDLPHARTHAVVLPHVLAFNAPGAPDAVARVARALGVPDPVRGLRALAGELGLPRGLRELGMTEDRIDEIAALTERAWYRRTTPYPSAAGRCSGWCGRPGRDHDAARTGAGRHRRGGGELRRHTRRPAARDRPESHAPPARVRKRGPAHRRGVGGGNRLPHPRRAHH
jgi:alcohol dehydrogenase class IV